MGLETGTTIADLVAANPTAEDKRRFGDDHLRLIKLVLKSTFPNLTQVDGVITPTATELNTLVGATGLIQTQLDAKVATADLDGLITAYEYASYSSGNAWSATQALAPVTLGNVSGIVNLTLSDADSYIMTLVDDITIVFTGSQAGQGLTLKLVQGSTGGYTVTWPGTMHFPNKTEPSLSTAPGDYDVVVGKQIGGRFVGSILRDVG